MKKKSLLHCLIDFMQQGKDFKFTFREFIQPGIINIAECRIAVGHRSNSMPMTGRCVHSSVGPGFDSVEFFFFFFSPPLFFFLPLLALDLHFFFSPPFFVLL